LQLSPVFIPSEPASAGKPLDLARSSAPEQESAEVGILAPWPRAGGEAAQAIDPDIAQHFGK
jgi:hypothetical protein